MSDRMREWAEELSTLQNKAVDTLVNVRPPADAHIRLSEDVEKFLEEKGESADEILQLPVIVPLPVDDARPLRDYFISSSHNTYLLSGQLLGHSSALSYVHVLWQHARCVEMDVWSSARGLVVTHGYTLSSAVLFREVCEAVGQAVREHDWPVLVSLECHVSVEGQPEIVQIMEECWGERLVRGPLGVEGTKSEVTPKDLKGRIMVMVEYYPPKNSEDTESQNAPPSSSSNDSSSDDESPGVEAKLAKPPKPSPISDTLAELGVYARSMKPSKDWLTTHITYPAHVMINISESALSALIPHSLDALIANAQRHLRRVYPRGTRIESSNPDPLASWSSGSQIAALNWQRYDLGVQMNEAMFAGTPGWVVKPKKLLGQVPSTDGRKMRLKCHVVGLSSLPVGKERTNVAAYVRAHLLYTGVPKDASTQWRSETVLCKNPEEGLADYFWDARFAFEYDADSVTFIRIRIKENIKYERDAERAAVVARVEQVQPGWRLMRMLDNQGKYLGATLLVHFEFEDVEAA
ncbi:hypothetical protein HETIRDRAFT_174607 [Heterobasidion irregulare TC 32-1]|uniref:Phosphoinositide phospholipase C n=1 Tax=Heterobasidion irregulare (strain TC 32-1) TaxID=747525 RepID=W4JUH1_HETIT|nr:uncharacterized protein HETIRDRAFT_174607 [Heterobasidion irregulare TC 32-1]ETW76531.1 hypothetical protein HETIRDRAFT_174607 [Heterobasidion irregulare TC 32-1]